MSDDAEPGRTPVEREMRSITLASLPPNSDSMRLLPAPIVSCVATPPPNTLPRLPSRLPSYVPPSSMRATCCAPPLVDAVLARAPTMVGTIAVMARYVSGLDSPTYAAALSTTSGVR